jgi:hypothetical protein
MRVRHVLLVAVSMLSTVMPALGTADDSVVGTWRLVSFKSRAADGSLRDLYGPAPAGQLIYDAAGHMSVHLLKPDLPKCATLDRRRCPDHTARLAFDNYFGYWGQYHVSVATSTVIHHIDGASVPDWVNTSQERHFKLEGNLLTLTTPSMQVAGVDTVQILVWERQ